MRDKVYYKREFLNTAENTGTAFIEAYIEGGGRKRDGSQESVNAGIKIGDCNRIIDLDFGVYFGAEDSGEVKRNVLQKIRRLRLAFATFETALKEALGE